MDYFVDSDQSGITQYDPVVSCMIYNSPSVMSWCEGKRHLTKELARISKEPTKPCHFVDVTLIYGGDVNVVNFVCCSKYMYCHSMRIEAMLSTV